MLPAPPPATLRLNIDRDALAANWRALDALSRPGRAGAAVKANCYGLGVDACVPALRDAGAADFFVAHWSEVAAVAAHVPAASIAVLHGPINRAEAEYARAVGARPVINSLTEAARWLEAGGGPCDVMVDTGINRLGLAAAELADPLIARLEVDTLLSHLACADEDRAMNEAQLRDFAALRQQLAARRASLANSAGIALGPRYAADLTRPGLALYGGVPRHELAGAIRQVAFPQAAVILTRQLKVGQSVGYNATFRATQDTPTAIVSLGYADGFLRCWAGASLAYHGSALPILGRVSMDMVVLDASAAPDLREGDWIDVPYTLPEASAATGLSQYELLTILGRRFHAEQSGCARDAASAKASA